VGPARFRFGQAYVCQGLIVVIQHCALSGLMMVTRPSNASLSIGPDCVGAFDEATVPVYDCLFPKEKQVGTSMLCLEDGQFRELCSNFQVHVYCIKMLPQARLSWWNQF